MIWVDGSEATGLPADDRGLHYGDGLFETMRVRDGVVPLLARHLARLSAGCQRLGLAAPSTAQLREEVTAAAMGQRDAVLKLVVTRGSGGRGYRAPTDAQARRVLSLHPAPSWPADLAAAGIRARTCATRLAIGGPLAGLKHLNRLEQVLARSEWQDETIPEGLMLDAEGSVVAGTMTNLFLIGDGALQTPRLDRCGVAGIARAMVLERAARLGIAVEDRRIARDALGTTTAAFVCNSVVGIWPLRELDGRACGSSPMIAALQAALRDEGLGA
jgi:4-amino-4-deoxychorismate lyase